MTNIDALLAIMARLRDPQAGCPWDRAQTFASIVPYTLEEAYEVADVIERDDLDELKAELGDLLFQVVFYAQMANEAGRFDFNDVVASIVEKMLRRHPHVFAAAKVGSAQEQAHAWEQHKAQERAGKTKGAEAGLLDDIPRALPAMTRALKLHKRASRVGFDWKRAADVLQKLDEEVEELRVEIQNNASHARITDEIGDLLFVTTILARHSDVDPESALRHANAKFERRFRRMETLAKEQGHDIKELSLPQQDALWDQVKIEERRSAKPDR